MFSFNETTMAKEKNYNVVQDFNHGPIHDITPTSVAYAIGPSVTTSSTIFPSKT
jgi:hypothetical protein